MINYKAGGSLFGAVEQTRGGHFVTIIYWDKKYVVSRYKNGASEWVSGKYFSDLTSALEEFARMTMLYCS